MKKFDEIREKLTTEDPKDYFSMLEFMLAGWIKIAEPSTDRMSKEELFNDEFYSGYIYGFADSALQGSSLELTKDLYEQIICELYMKVHECSKEEGEKKFKSIIEFPFNEMNKSKKIGNNPKNLNLICL